MKLWLHFIPLQQRMRNFLNPQEAVVWIIQNKDKQKQHDFRDLFSLYIN